MRAVIYARVSSSAQRDAQTIANQLRVLPAYVKAQGWILVDTYIDDGRSASTGKLDRRDGFARLVRDAEAGKFDIVVVVDLDRLTRTNDMTERAAILSPFQRRGIRIATPSSGILDMRTMLGELYVALQTIFAAEENRKRLERTTAGKERTMAEGGKAQGVTPFGLAYDRETRAWSLNEPAAVVVREIARRIIAGEPCLDIARDLNGRGAPSPKGPWTRHNVWWMARSRHTVGEWIADKRRNAVVRIPAIITEETWQRVQASLAAHGKRGLRRTRHVYLLEGLAVCGRCGEPIAIRSATGGNVAAAYICRARKLREHGPRCDAPTARTDDTDAAVWAAVSQTLESPALAAELAVRSAASTDNRLAWERDVTVYRNKLERLAEVEAGHLGRARRGLVSDEALEIELRALRRERDELKRQLAVAERAARSPVAAPEADPTTWLESLRALASEATPEARQRVVRAIVPVGAAVLKDGRVKLKLEIGREAHRPVVVAMESSRWMHRQITAKIRRVK